MEHQNWDYVTFTKKANNKKILAETLKKGDDADIEVVKKMPASNKQTESANIKKIIDSDDYKIDTIPHELKIALQQARTKKGLKQTELAALISEKAGVINDYEAGRALPNMTMILKLERALGVKLPHPKKKKTNVK